MSKLTSIQEWRIDKLLADDPNTAIHNEEAFKRWKKEVDPEPDPEDEKGPISEIYDAYVTRLAKRLDKHHEMYEKYAAGSIDPDKFFQDAQAIKMLMEDFCAYLDRFAKTAGIGGGKGKR